MNMAKKAPKKSIGKKNFDLSSFKKTNGMDITVKEKDLTWIPMSDSFHEALKIPGLARGYFTSFRGYSNTGKSTAIYEAVAGAQKIGDLPVIIETESNWSWEHAKNIGVKFEEVIDEETGEIIDYEGDFIFMNSDDLLQRYKFVDYSNGKEGTKQLRGEPVIEDVARIISDLLDAQEDGDLPRNLCFLWDSVGSINGFKSVNKVIKHKGGEAFFYSPRVIVHFGGILSHSTVKLKATSGGETYQFGIETKVRCEKNQVNGIEEHGKLASTPHGYWNPTKIDDYKKQHKDYILKRLNTTLDDFVIEKEEQGFGMDDLGE